MFVQVYFSSFLNWAECYIFNAKKESHEKKNVFEKKNLHMLVNICKYLVCERV